MSAWAPSAKIIFRAARSACQTWLLRPSAAFPFTPWSVQALTECQEVLSAVPSCPAPTDSPLASHGNSPVAINPVLLHKGWCFYTAVQKPCSGPPLKGLNSSLTVLPVSGLWIKSFATVWRTHHFFSQCHHTVRTVTLLIHINTIPLLMDLSCPLCYTIGILIFKMFSFYSAAVLFCSFCYREFKI